MKYFNAVLVIMIFISSCKSQSKTGSENILPNYQNSELRIIKTQGTSQYAAINDGLQDKSGDLWFSSSGEGVYRYDGKTFFNYTETDGLSNNFVWCIFEDKDGRIWFGTANGLCRYDPTDSKTDSVTFKKVEFDIANFNQFYPPTSTSSYPNEENSIWDIIQDKKDRLWFATTKGIYIYDGKSFIHFMHNDGVVNNTGFKINKVESILEDKAGNIWFGGRSSEGLFRFDGKSIFNYDPENKNWLRPVYEDKEGNIWFNSRMQSIYKYDGKDFISFGKKELEGWVLSSIQDKSGNYWYASAAGLSKYDGKKITTYTTKDGLSNNDVFNITLDKSGLLWIGGRGVSLCSFDGILFKDYSDKSIKDISTVFEDKTGNLWLATIGKGVCRYDPNVPVGSEKSLNYITEKEGLSGNEVRKITEDKEGNIWFGTNKGLSKYNGNHFVNYDEKNGLKSLDIRSLLVHKKGTIWVATVDGVYNSSIAKKGDDITFIHFDIPAAIQEDFSRLVTGTKLIWDIKEDRAGNIWFATNGAGVFKYDGKTLSNISEKDGLSSNFVNCILEDKKGDLWFATQHGGVCVYNPVTKIFKKFTEKEALNSRAFWTIYEDKKGNIWVPDKGHGIKRYDGNRFINLSGNEGLTREYVQSIFEDSKGQLWLGCNGGLCRFNGKSFDNLTREWVLRKL